ncbi:MAG TPA: hypothetical protein VLL05_00030 [Terriglobales bacterium]|nr:hypothetical protein [Terriglobales bacterium]
MISRKGIAATIVVMLVAAFQVVQAQERIQFAEYSAKFLCGEEKGGGPVRPGAYETSINIHNPEIVSSVTFFKKVVLAPPEPQAQKEPIPPSRFRRDVLKQDFAEHVDCKIIRSMLGPAGGAPFVEGFVVLIVVPTKGVPPSDLDVVGVYTVGNPQGQDTDLEMLPAARHVLTFPVGAATKLQDQMLEDSKKE